MRRVILIVAAAATLVATGWAARSAATEPARPSPAAQHHTGQTAPGTGDSRMLATQLAKARLATAKYATDLGAAKADGYQIITRMIPDMGWHFLNPAIQGFHVTRPPILVYERHGSSWQLGALEWVFPTKPATPPLPGATYGTFGAACHYKDGTFVFASSEDQCAKRSPQTGAAFNFWHPDRSSTSHQDRDPSSCGPGPGPVTAGGMTGRMTRQPNRESSAPDGKAGHHGPTYADRTRCVPPSRC